MRRFKADLLARLDHAQAAADKLIQRWGKPDSWGRGQVAAMVLLAHHPDLGLKEIWPDETGPGEFAAHVVCLLVGMPELRPHREIVAQVIREAARDQVQGLVFWADAEPGELAGYLVLRSLAAQVGLQNPSMQLAGLKLFSPDLQLSQMELVVLQAIELLRKQGAMWAAVEQAAEAFLTPKRAAKALALLPAVSGGEQGAAILLAQTTPAILRQQLLSVLGDFFVTPSPDGWAWVPSLEHHPLLREDAALTDRARQCRAGLRLLLVLHRLEQRLSVPVPTFPHADALLDWYVAERHHLLELELARAAHFLAELDDDGNLQQGHEYLFGLDEQRPSPESLKGRIVARLDHLSSMLASFVRENPEGFGRGARSVRGLLREKIDPKQIAADTLPGRVWVLVFDGMRLDTWEAVVRPLFAEFFEIEDAPYFSLLPSYTEFARTGLLAGGLPGEWKGFKGSATQDEAQLFAVHMGLTAQEAKSKLRYVTAADTTKARRKMGLTDQDAALLNVLIYPISDEEAHEFKGDLASFNNTIRAKMLGDKGAGIRGILDDLLRRIRPEDIVVLASDHGFTELLQGDAVTVMAAEAKQAGASLEQSVYWQYVIGFKPTDTAEAVQVPVGQRAVWVAVGRRWFMREGTKAIPRYSHGGLSLAEMVVPGVVLRRVTEKAARAEVLDLPTVLVADEDAVVALPFTVRNSGNVEVSYEVRVEDNLGQELLREHGRLAAAMSVTLTASVQARYRETASREPDPTRTVSGVTIRLRHTDLEGRWREAMDGHMTVPVRVKPKAVKFDTEALKGFDDV